MFNHPYNTKVSPDSMQYQTIATTDNMDHRAALANITNMEVDNSKYGESIKDQLLNNKENLIEQVSRQKMYLDSFIVEDEEEREEEQEPMETELPSYVSPLPSASDDQVASPKRFDNEYLKDIEVYFHQRELECPVKENYLEGCPVTNKMRTILVDWLVDVQVQFDLLQETLFLAINILDRFLQEEGHKIYNRVSHFSPNFTKLAGQKICGYLGYFHGKSKFSEYSHAI